MLFLSSWALADDTCLEFGTAEASVVVEDIPAFESSGVAASPEEPGTYYTHGDNGDEATLYVFQSDGVYVGEQAVRGATNEDWEDLANGPCPDGDGACLWIADIGDNDDTRPTVTLYVVPASFDAAVDATACVFTYPEQPSNAEALLVFPDGAVRIVTKHTDGAAKVFLAASPRCDGSVETLVEEAEIQLDAAVTGGAVSPDGTTVVLRTYAGAWMWQGCTLDWTQSPIAVDLGSEAQGEAISFTADGGLVTTSEGDPFRVRTLPCAATGEVPCTGCGCGGSSAGWLVVPGILGWLRRRGDQRGRRRSR